MGCPIEIYAGLASLSEGCPPVEGRLHTCYSPVRQSPAESASTLPAALRLACVKPAASVHPEPGSNSPLLVSCFQNSSNCSFTGPGSLFFIAGILTGLIFLSLYSSNNFRCFVLMASCQCSPAVPGTSFHLLCLAASVVSFPKRECKITAFSDIVQIFSSEIFKIMPDIRLSC